MWMFDFNIFYSAGRELLAGNSPYIVDGFFSPLPLGMFFVPFAVLPESVAYILYLILSLWILWKVVRQRLLLALLFFPVLFTLFVGQVDLLFTLSTVLLGPYALPLLLAKPQLGFVLFPWLFWNSKPKHVIAASLLTFILLAACFFIRPQWIAEWREAIPSVASYSSRDSNLYWLVSQRVKDTLALIASPIALIVGMLLHKRKDSWVALSLFVPISNIYSTVTLVEWIGPIEIALSWLAIAMTGGNIHSGAPIWIVGLSIVTRSMFSSRRNSVEQKRYAAYTTGR